MACTLLSTRICNGALYDERRIHSRKVERETLDERCTRIASEESIAPACRLALLSLFLLISEVRLDEMRDSLDQPARSDESEDLGRSRSADSRVRAAPLPDLNPRSREILSLPPAAPSVAFGG